MSERSIEHDQPAGPCVIGRGVRQWCLLSPQLFNIYAEAIMKESMEGVEDRVLVGGHLVQAVRFADDQAMIASSVNGLQNIMTKLNDTVKEFKMRINEKKTKVMKIGRGEAEEVKIPINGNELEQVHQFKYLGTLITEDGRSERNQGPDQHGKRGLRKTSEVIRWTDHQQEPQKKTD